MNIMKPDIDPRDEVMQVVLINPYELGRQPFGLAEPATLLTEAGCSVVCIDLSVQKLEPALLERAQLVGIYIAMHTATRIAIEVISRLKDLAPNAHLCVYGLYAPMNEDMLRELGVGTILGGEFESGLLSMIDRLQSNNGTPQTEPVINLSKVSFRVPDRSVLPPLERYAHLILPNGSKKICGFVETSRGCKHFCRHCPVVPVYEGRFRIVPQDVIAGDIRNQVEAGAKHISFGDPDFLNGPTHALEVVRRLHQDFPHITYDATIKLEHILKHQNLLPTLKQTGCLFITSAIESVVDQILEYFDKNHTNKDFGTAVKILHDVGIHLAPTFVAFTPWTTLTGYVDFLCRIVELKLIECIPPIQLAIRLLIPKGSHLFKLSGFEKHVEQYDPTMLGYPWHHEDPRVDQLQQKIQGWVAQSEQRHLSRCEIFTQIWALAHDMIGKPTPVLLDENMGRSIPRLSEPWYCCAEPTNDQLVGF